MVIYSNNDIVLTANRYSRIYIMDMLCAENSLRCCFFSRSQSNVNQLWHKRLSHLNFKATSKISNDHLVRGLSKINFIKDKQCSTCEKEKQTNSPFKPKQCSSVVALFRLCLWTYLVFFPLDLMLVVFLCNKNDIAEEIISLIKQCAMLYDRIFKQLRGDSGTEF